MPTLSRLTLLTAGALLVLALAGCRFIAGYESVDAGTAEKEGGGSSEGLVKLDGGIVPMPALSRLMGGKGDDVAHAVAVDLDGNLYVVGETRSEFFDLGDGSEPLARPAQSVPGLSDLFVVSISKEGVTRWAHRIGGAGDSVARDVSVCADQVVVGGESRAAGLLIDTLPVSPRGQGKEILVAALGAVDGRVRWASLYGGDGDDMGASVCCAGERVWLMGSTSSQVLDIPGTQGPAASLSGADFFILGMMKNGQPVSIARDGGSADDHGLAIAVGGATDQTPWLWFVGGSASSDWPGDNGAGLFAFGGYIDPNAPDDRFVASFYGTGDEEFKAVVVDEQKGALMVGTSDSDNLVAGGAQGVDILVGVGEVIGWARAQITLQLIQGEGDDRAEGIARLPSGDVVVVGSSDSKTIGGHPIAQRGELDVLLVRSAWTGVVVSADSFGASGNDVGRGIAMNVAGDKVYVVGEVGQPSTSDQQIDLGEGSSKEALGGKDAFITVLSAP